VVTSALPSTPFSAFNFAVEISVNGVSPNICSAAFAECDGLDMRMQVRTIREGGNNERQIQLAGPVSYSNLTLRRGMTPNFDLWHWFAKTVEPGGATLRSSRAVVVLLDADGVTERVRFILERCLPVRLKAPTLHALEGQVAVEELEIAFELLRVEQPT
jgi:phage tail-like protein